MAGKGKKENLKPPWKPGQTGNPKGGPKRKPITDALLEALEKNKVGKLDLPNGRTLIELIIEAWVRNIVAGNQRAISDLMDRLEGKVSDDPPAEAGSPLVDTIRAFLAERPPPEDPPRKARVVRKSNGRKPTD